MSIYYIRDGKVFLYKYIYDINKDNLLTQNNYRIVGSKK